MIGDYKTFQVDYASVEDVDYLAPRLREQDLAEVHSSQTPHNALMVGLVSGQSYTLLVDDEPVGIFGSCEVDEGLLSIWLVGSDSILKIKRDLLTYGKLFANTLIGNYKYGSNAVWEENVVSRRWLKYLGAEFDEAVQIDGKNFLPFKLYPTRYV
jgi:hypothetical protein